ncbi:MAG TPA: glycosyltransferase family 2 protein [Thermodesulfovibrionales bacterium]|nr:glycosyltransferase family 2 protein [Thermodesulfovibrionales bacterium]
MPSVSIILPVYSRSQTLYRSVRSVLAQSYTDFELIIVDDGSRDETETVARDLAVGDNRIRYISHETNYGQSKARNTGIAAAQGEYVAFQDSDDEWLPDKLKQQVDEMGSVSPAVGMVYCLMWRVTQEGQEVFRAGKFKPADADIYRKGLMYGFRGIGIQSCLFRREVFDVCGGFDEKMKALEDMELLIRVSRKYRFSCIDEPLLLYYRTPDGVSQDHFRNLVAAQYILEKYRDDIRSDKRVLALQ